MAEGRGVSEDRGFAAREVATRIIANVERVALGKRPVVVHALAALLAEGHVLFEDVPGVAKTMIARSLAVSLGCEFRRLQCTPDLLPTEVTGSSIFNQKTAEFEFRAGPIFTNVLLADEINRATPRTQAALLECMAETQVSADGVTYDLPRPFAVIATQNPVEQEGTFPLPEAQLDRFLVRLTVGYPSLNAEQDMLERQRLQHPIETLRPVTSASEFADLQRATREVYVHEQVRAYMVQLVHASRRHDHVALGGSPRATLALYRTAQALALISGRIIRGQVVVLPDHVQEMFPYVMAHRLITRPESRLEGITPGSIADDLLRSVPAPVAKA
ncbi:MAG: AAA family ATPase [Fimbriimonadaceae bacterium]|nr:AAA family ATPase [Fimbriimonadaceae bacterium]